jgi:hypothetical protein
VSTALEKPMVAAPCTMKHGKFATAGSATILDSNTTGPLALRMTSVPTIRQSPIAIFCAPASRT